MGQLTCSENAQGGLKAWLKSSTTRPSFGRGAYKKRPAP